MTEKEIARYIKRQNENRFNGDPDSKKMDTQFGNFVKYVSWFIIVCIIFYILYTPG